MTLIEIDKIFRERHTFDCEDLDILKDRYSWIYFANIPEAWIIPLDTFLSKHSGKILFIYQYFGTISIIYNTETSIKEDDARRKLEKVLQRVDIDLFEGEFL